MNYYVIYLVIVPVAPQMTRDHQDTTQDQTQVEKEDIERRNIKDALFDHKIL